MLNRSTTKDKPIRAHGVFGCAVLLNYVTTLNRVLAEQGFKSFDLDKL